MPKGPAARLGDVSGHGAPLVPGPGSTTVFIGGQPAWRGVGPGAAAAIVAAAAAALGAVMEAQANLAKVIAEQIAKVSAQMFSTGADTIACPIVKVVIPDGPGVVINGSTTVFIGGFPASRVGDVIQEVTSVNSVAMGCPTVIIGG
jgi:uncharacterized Zn-binding protein involved in type VI secretion